MRAFWLSSVLLTVALGCRSGKDAGADTGAGAVADGPVDGDGDGFDDTEDCNDADAAVSPAAVELCDGLDNNCDGVVDEDVMSTWYGDADEDGFGDPDAPVEACAAPDGAVTTATDCDDNDGDTWPGASERCDDVDNDCDGEIDEDVLSAWYQDADGDGFGDPDTEWEVCDPPAEWVGNDEDCDDTAADAWPGAEEVCDEIDNDCDGDVDEAVTTTYYVDADGDGFGVSDRTTDACALPTGYAVGAGDCDDADDTVSPVATELCDDIDNDCDGDVDESDAADASTWYSDSDSDGYGDAGSTAVACDAPSGTVAVGPGDDFDCDDAADDVYPGADEICDAVDNDCDGDVDDDDATLVGADTWYLDYDGDGFGATTITIAACNAPTAYVADATDCDDLVAAVNPDASEVCDGVDNDCNGDVDDADAGLDASSRTSWYADVDGDGFGDADTWTDACDQPSTYLADGTDCDDGDADVNPDAAEVCDDVDNDCDGDIDDDDADLVGGTTEWFEDYDSDGYGDPDSSVDTCDQPSGYVSNDEDCDDHDAGDEDGDGEQDCADDDIDGDGLRNEWDADEYDDTVARGPTGGLGTDGARSLISSSELASDWTLLSAGGAAGDTTLTVDDASIFVSGNELLVLSQQGVDAGTLQFVFVSAVSGTSVDIEPPLDTDFDASSVVLVQVVPHYTTLDVPSGTTLTGDEWAGAGGGVVVARATGAVTIDGSVDVSALGFRGGDGPVGNSGDPYQGESYLGTGASGTTSANEGGGGSYPRRGDNADSGGGGGYGSAGSAGTSYSGASVTSGGNSYGDAELGDWFVGSGGGGGSPDTESDGSSTSNVCGDGGAGGGIIGLFSATSITITGAVSANGEDGGDASPADGEIGGGGAGSGGQIWLAAPALTLGSGVSASGGEGGVSGWHSGTPYGSAYGGDAGDGRVRLDYDSVSGSTTPTAGHTAAYAD